MRSYCFIVEVTFKNVKETFDWGELNIPDVIDQAYWIVPEYLDYKTKRKCKAIIIIRFTTFKYIPLLYQAKIKIRNNIKKCLDLTEERHALLLEPYNFVKRNNSVKFHFVDIINCPLKIKCEDELRPDSFFSSLEGPTEKSQVN